MDYVTIVGGGLAGCEAAWQAAEEGIKVKLYEMRPIISTGAHVSGDLAEIVCSNSLGSQMIDRASGLLKEELRQLGSFLLRIAEDNSVPAGSALAIDRMAFSKAVTHAITTHPNISCIREEYVDIPGGPAVIATGPLTSESMTKSIQQFSGKDNLYFYDAISPSVYYDSIDLTIAYRANRYGRGETEDGDYINCPLTKYEYQQFVEALLGAERIELKEFELDIKKGVKTGKHNFFEGCLPVEIIAERGVDSLAYGPMRPVGLWDPRNKTRPYAVIQLRQDNAAGSVYNIVGFQTNLKVSEQKRVFQMIPGLKNADFSRYGQMHRNTFIYSPSVISPTLESIEKPGLFFAGQITGVEGYVGNIATGLLAGKNVARFISGQQLLELPNTTMLGSLCNFISSAKSEDYQPVKANFGIVPPIEPGVKKNKRERAQYYSARSLEGLRLWKIENEL